MNLSCARFDVAPWEAPLTSVEGIRLVIYVTIWDVGGKPNRTEVFG